MCVCKMLLQYFIITAYTARMTVNKLSDNCVDFLHLSSQEVFPGGPVGS